MVEDVDRFLRVSVDCEVVYKQKLDLRIVLDLLHVLGQILTLQNGKTVKEIAVVHELASEVLSAGLDATGCQEVGFSCICHAVDSDILPVIHEREGEHLLDSAVVVNPAVACSEVLNSGISIEHGAEPQVRFETAVPGFQIWPFNLSFVGRRHGYGRPEIMA